MRWVAPSLALCALLSASAVHAQEGRGWSRALGRPDEPRFTGGFAIDRAVRRALRAPTPSGRDLAASISDTLLFTLLSAPMVTATIYSLRGDGFPPAAGELTLVSMEAQLGVLLTVTLIKNLAGRQRPLAWAAELDAACRDPERAETLDCSSGRNESFLSGHSAAAFTGAGLVCAQSAYFGVDTGWDVAACVAASTAASTTATLRIVADRHWATDTIAGALVGLAWGALVPSLLHFADDAPLPVARALRGEERRSFAGMIAAGAGLGVLIAAVLPIAVALISDREDDPLVDVLANLRLAPIVGPASTVGMSADGRF
jgi:membrane-associated phospholipid phosphatase